MSQNVAKCRKMSQNVAKCHSNCVISCKWKRNRENLHTTPLSVLILLVTKIMITWQTFRRSRDVLLYKEKMEKKKTFKGQACEVIQIAGSSARIKIEDKEIIVLASMLEDAEDYDQLSKAELIEEAKAKGLEINSKATKAEIIEALTAA